MEDEKENKGNEGKGSFYIQINGYE